jgi:hypothetical protein
MKTFTGSVGIKKYTLKEGDKEFFSMEMNKAIRADKAQIMYDGKEFQADKIEFAFGKVTYHIATMSGESLGRIEAKVGFQNDVTVFINNEAEFYLDGSGFMNSMLRFNGGLLFRMFIAVTYKIFHNETQLGKVSFKYSGKKVEIDEEEKFNNLSENEKVLLLSAISLIAN